MNSPPNQGDKTGLSGSDDGRDQARPVKVEDILKDLHAGLRTKGFLVKYEITLAEFESILKGLLRKGLFTKEEYKQWKAKRPEAAPPKEKPPAENEAPPKPSGPSHKTVTTYVIKEPEKNHPWALQLFSTHRDRMAGAQFKVRLHGKKYAFVIEKMLFRGSVKMLVDQSAESQAAKDKRQQALEFIASHGWAAYLENRAISANLQDEEPGGHQKARLVLLHCRNDTFLAALHTPAPAINLYVGASLDKIRRRLAKSIDTTSIDIVS